VPFVILNLRGKRDGEIVVPHGDTVLQLQDILMLVGSPGSLVEASRSLEGDTEKGPVKVTTNCLAVNDRGPAGRRKNENSGP
jgi:uncharacterized transporter YbjL